jgi:hypothetical protein
VDGGISIGRTPISFASESDDLVGYAGGMVGLKMTLRTKLLSTA